MASADYDRIEFRRLRDIPPDAIIELINDPVVRRHLPLARGEFGISECTRFVATKERIWDEQGFGPWAFVLDGEFIGWGGFSRRAKTWTLAWSSTGSTGGQALLSTAESWDTPSTSSASIPLSPCSRRAEHGPRPWADWVFAKKARA